MAGGLIPCVRPPFPAAKSGRNTGKSHPPETGFIPAIPGRLFVGGSRSARKGSPFTQNPLFKAKVSAQWRTSLVHVLVKLGKRRRGRKSPCQRKGRGSDYRPIVSDPPFYTLKTACLKRHFPSFNSLRKTANPNPHWLIALASTLDRLDRPEEASKAMEKVDPEQPSPIRQNATPNGHLLAAARSSKARFSTASDIGQRSPCLQDVSHGTN
jgi:hypothetical protein